MIKSILTDFSRVILHPKDKTFNGGLNGQYKELKQNNPEFNFHDYYEFNDDVLDAYHLLKDKYSFNIFTTGTIQNSPEVKEKLGDLFDNIFSAEELGLDKKDPHAYEVIADKLGIPIDQIMFVDDQDVNVAAARRAGMSGVVFTEHEKLKAQIHEALQH